MSPVVVPRHRGDALRNVLLSYSVLHVQLVKIKAHPVMNHAVERWTIAKRVVLAEHARKK